MAEEDYTYGGEVDWGEAGAGSGGSSRDGIDRREITYLRISEDTPIRIRLVGKAVKYFKHWNPIVAVSCGPDHDVCWKEGGHKPRRRYSVWVIDRADGQMKVLDFGAQLMKHFSNWSKLFKKNPGGPDGTDWLVSKEIPTSKNESGSYVKDKRNTTYSAVHDAPTPFSDDELAMIQAKVEKCPLAKLRKPDTPERIAELWEEYKENPEGLTPGSSKWWQARREANAEASGDVKFDDDKNTADIAEAPADTETPAQTEAPVQDGTASGETSEDKSDGGDEFSNLFDEGDEKSESADLF